MNRPIISGLAAGLVLSLGAPAMAGNNKTPPGDPCGSGPGVGAGNPCKGNNGNEGANGNAHHGDTGSDQQPEAFTIPRPPGSGAFVTQIGDENTATIGQKANTQFAAITQFGDSNTADVSQSGSGAHYALAAQAGDFNELHLAQAGGAPDVALLLQGGSGNTMTFDQRGGAVSSGIAATQLGDGNRMSLTQSGGNNQALLVQTGSNNEMNASQTGGNNQLAWSQLGDNLSHVAINQTGGQALQVTQTPVRCLPLLLAALALGPGISAAAQQAEDRTRLDEFAVPSEQAGTEVEQLDTAGRDVVPRQAAASERSVAISGPPTVRGAPVRQLSRRGGAGPPPQVSSSANSREVEPGSVSSPADSRPSGVTRLSGQDRCDPAADAKDLALCRRILELRANEFTAAEAPRLSAEQALLAAQAQRDTPADAASLSQRARVAATGSGDADLESSQELGSIYLDRQKSGSNAAEATTPQTGVNSETLAQVLRTLQVDVATSSPAGR